MGVSEILVAFKGLEPLARTPWPFPRVRPHKILTKMHNPSGRQGHSGKNMTRQRRGNSLVWAVPPGWTVGDSVASVLIGHTGKGLASQCETASGVDSKGQ